MVLTVGDLCDHMEELSPLSFAEGYDNAGLLVGRRTREVRTLMLAVDASRSVIGQALEAHADMLLVHHPLIFHPLKNASESDYVGERVLSLAEGKVALYAAHTNLDSVPGGNIDRAASLLGLENVRAVAEEGETPCLRIGELPEAMSLEDLSHQVMERWDLPYVRMVPSPGKDLVRQVAVCTGSGMSFAPLAERSGADVLITGDIGFHRAEEAADNGLCLIDASHFDTDRLSLRWLEEDLQDLSDRKGAGLTILTAEEKDVFRLVTRRS